MALPIVKELAGVVSAPETGTTQGGKNWIRFRAGFSKSRYNDQTQQWETVSNFYVEVTAWDQRAQQVHALNLQQGDQVFLEFELKTDTWEKDGNKYSKPAGTIRTCRRLEKRQQGGQPQGGFQQQPQQPAQQGSPWGSQQGGGQQAQQGGWGGAGDDQRPPF